MQISMIMLIRQLNDDQRTLQLYVIEMLQWKIQNRLLENYEHIYEHF